MCSTVHLISKTHQARFAYHSEFHQATHHIMSLYTVQAVLLLDTDGNRLFSKYYTPLNRPDLACELVTEGTTHQREFEQKLVSKTKAVNGDVIILDNHLICYKQMTNVILYLVSTLDENEALIFHTLLHVRDVIDSVLEHCVDKTNILHSYDKVSLAIDSMIDNGVILSNNSSSVTSRITLHAEEEPSLQNLDFSEAGFKSVFDFARGKITQAVRTQF